MKRNLPFYTKAVPGNTPGTATSIIIDRVNYRSALIGLAVADVAADSGILAKIQTGDMPDGSDMADFLPDGPGNPITTEQLTVSNTNTFKDVDLSGAKQYIQLVFTTTGTAPTFSSSVTLGDAQYGDDFNA